MENGANSTVAPQHIDNSTILRSNKEQGMESSSSVALSSKISTTLVDANEHIETNTDNQSVVLRSAKEKSLHTEAIDKYSKKLKNQALANKRSVVNAVSRKTEKPSTTVSSCVPPSKNSKKSTKATASNQISENYVRMDLKKRWRGKKKHGSGKYRAHKEFLRKRAENTAESNDSHKQKNRQMNSGRDIIDNLLELSDNSKGNLDGADVPKCPGHGYPCVKKIVKKSGKNKGRNFTFAH